MAGVPGRRCDVQPPAEAAGTSAADGRGLGRTQRPPRVGRKADGVVVLDDDASVNEHVRDKEAVCDGRPALQGDAHGGHGSRDGLLELGQLRVRPGLPVLRRRHNP